MQKGRPRVTVRLDEAEIVTLKKLGGGEISAGLRIAVSLADSRERMRDLRRARAEMRRLAQEKEELGWLGRKCAAWFKKGRSSDDSS